MDITIKESIIDENTKITIKSGVVKLKVDRNDKTIIQLENGSVVGLNQTASYIFSVCNGLTVFEIANKLQSNCINSEEIDSNVILNDCIAALMQMEKQDLITTK